MCSHPPAKCLQWLHTWATCTLIEIEPAYVKHFNLQKEKEKVEKLSKPPTYKVYTMKDYKKLKLEYKLGGLGPSQDPQELKHKVSNEISP